MPCTRIGGFIVKRFISLLIALVLLVSMFALPTFALADEETPDQPGVDEEKARELTFDPSVFAKYVIENNKGYFIEMSKEFKLNLSWTEPAEEEGKEDIVHKLLEEAQILHELFGEDLHYLVLPSEDLMPDANVDHNKTVVVYKSVDPETEEATEKKDGDGYLEYKHVTLQASTYFEAPEGYVFAGWRTNVDYDGTILPEGKTVLYRAGDKFSMPYVNPTYKKDENGEDIKDENGKKVVDKLGEIVIEAQWAPEAKEGEEQPKPEYTYPKNDIICLEYCSPSGDPKDDNWTRVEAGSEISIDASGFWMFRLVVIDGENGDITDDDAVITPYNSEDFRKSMLDENGEVYHWEKFTLTRYAVDTTNPEIALSSTMKTKMKDGLTVGTNYSISTSLTITDSSSAPATYVVYRQSANDGAGKDSKDGWVKIYDSTTKEVAKDAEAYITASGTINPQSNDVTTEGNYRYKIVYTVKDANGYFGVGAEDDENGFTDESGFHPTLYLGVKPSSANDQAKKKMEVWKIILFVIAGLSAVGIVVLLFIKPTDAATSSSSVDADSDADASVDSDSGSPDVDSTDSDDTK